MINVRNNQFLFVEKYRPQSLEECILPDHLKDFFRKIIEKGEIPNLILNGKPGIGKTSVAIAILEEMGRDYIKINGALKNGIDAVRNDISDFASSMSFNEGRKYIILDEGDGLNNNAQEALKSLIEEFASNAGFIITCNDKRKLNEAIQSRFSVVDFVFSSEDFQSVANLFFIRLKEILDNENITYEPRVLANVIRRYYPDWRKTLNQVQMYAIKNGSIDSGILSVSLESIYNHVAKLLKDKEWQEMRKWVGENNDIATDFAVFARRLLKVLEDKISQNSIQNYIVLFNEYDFKQAFVVDKETNVTAFLTQIMTEMEWK